MGCASGIKVPGLLWKDQGIALKVSLNQIALSCPGQASPRKRGSPDQLPLSPVFLYPFYTVIVSVLLALCGIIFQLHETHFQFSHHLNQTFCLFLMSNCIIQSLHPL